MFFAELRMPAVGNAQFLTGIVPGQLLGPHFLEYQQKMTNTVQTGETILLQLLFVIG